MIDYDWEWAMISLGVGQDVQEYFLAISDHLKGLRKEKAERDKRRGQSSSTAQKPKQKLKKLTKASHRKPKPRHLL